MSMNEMCCTGLVSVGGYWLTSVVVITIVCVASMALGELTAYACTTSVNVFLPLFRFTDCSNFTVPREESNKKYDESSLGSMKYATTL